MLLLKSRGNRIGMGALLAIALTGIAWGRDPGVAPGQSWTLAAHVAVAGDLQGPGTEYAQRLMDAASSGGWALCMQLDGADGVLSRRKLTAGGTVTEEEVGEAACPEEAIASLLSSAREFAPADRYVLIVYGHDVRTTPELEDALTFRAIGEGATRGIGRAVDLLVLDRCYGACVEALWELRESVDVLVAAPGRRPSRGIEWEGIIGHSEPSRYSCTKGLARRLVRQEEAAAGRGMVALRPRYATEVADAVGRLVEAMEGRMESVVPVLSRAIGQAGWGGDERTVDLRGLCGHVASACDGDIAAAAEATITAIERSTMAGKDGCDAGPGISFRTTGALQEETREPRRSLADETGWTRLVEAYENRLRTLMNRPSRAGSDEAA